MIMELEALEREAIKINGIMYVFVAKTKGTFTFTPDSIVAKGVFPFSQKETQQVTNVQREED